MSRSQVLTEDRGVEVNLKRTNSTVRTNDLGWSADDLGT